MPADVCLVWNGRYLKVRDNPNIKKRTVEEMGIGYNDSEWGSSLYVQDGKAYADERFAPETEAYRARIKESAQRTIDQAQKNIDRAIEQANRDIERAERRIAIIEQFGEDEYENDTVLAFQKTFPSSNKVYDYVAYKVNDKWYLTGPKQSGLYYNWGGLIDFIVSTSDPNTIKLWRVAQWDRIV